MELVSGKQLKQRLGNESIDLRKSIVNELSGEEDSPIKDKEKAGLSTFSNRMNGLSLDTEKIEIKVKQQQIMKKLARTMGDGQMSYSGKSSPN